MGRGGEGNHIKVPSHMDLKTVKEKFNKVSIELFTAYNITNRVLLQKLEGESYYE